MLIQDCQRVVNALKDELADLSGNPVRVTRGWPKTFEALPCAAVQEAANTHWQRRDDTDYIERIITDVRVFAVEADEIDALAPRVEAVMTSLGYVRTMAFDQNEDAEIRMKILRYKGLF